MQNQIACGGIEVLRLSRILCKYVKDDEIEQLSVRSNCNYFKIKKCDKQFSPNIVEYNNVYDVYRVLLDFVRENYDRCRAYNSCIEIKCKSAYYIVCAETV